jgi:hypothetical protein
MATSLSALRTSLSLPQEDSWYSFLLETESTPGPECGWKYYDNWNIQWPHRESNPRPYDLYHSASTNYATACPASSLLGPDIFLSTSFSDTLSPYSFFHNETPNSVCSQHAKLFVPCIVTIQYIIIRRRDSSVGIPMGYQGWRNRVRFQAVQDFSLLHCVQTGSGVHPASYPMCTGGKSGRGVMLTTRLHAVSRSRIRGAIPPLPHVFMA